MPKPTVEFIGGATVETVPLPTQNFEAVHAVDDVVRLHEYVGTKKARALLYRVVELPDPKAKRKAEREGYAIEPIAGGPRTRAENWMLVPGSEADKALAARTPRVTERFFPGMVVTCANLRGVAADEKMVVLDIARDGTAKITKLGGMEGRYYPGIPVARLVKAQA